VVRSGDSFSIVLTVNKTGDSTLENVVASVALNIDGRTTWLVRSSFTRSELTLRSALSEIVCSIDNLALVEGTYAMTVFLSYRDVETLDCIEDAFGLRVEAGDYFRTGSRGLPSHCKVLTSAEWKVCENS